MGVCFTVMSVEYHKPVGHRFIEVYDDVIFLQPQVIVNHKQTITAPSHRHSKMNLSELVHYI